MGKGHRDNHAARKKRGPVAFELKAKRRFEPKTICNLCGNKVRPSTVKAGLCKACLEKYGQNFLETL
jgi:hypothetical protein